MPVVTASSKGQVVIPKEEREKLGIKPGTKVSVEVVDDHVEIRPLPEDPIAALRGVLKGGPSMTKALLRDRKEELKLEEKKSARLLRRARLASG